MKKILYILPTTNFFTSSDGVGGKVSHAAGILNAFTKKHYEIVTLVAEDHDILNGTRKNILATKSHNLLYRQIWNRNLIKVIKDILSKEDFSFCYLRYAVAFTPWIKSLKKVLGKTPLVMECNSLGGQYFNFYNHIDRMMIGSADVLLSVSEINRQHILNNVDKRLESKTFVLPNGVDLDRFDGVEQVVRDRNRINVGYTGIVQKGYGLEIMFEGFVKASQKRKDLLLHVYGGGKDLELFAENFKNDNIIFYGIKPFKDMPSIIKSFDILINSSSNTVKQNSPIKLFEYMAANKPIIHGETFQVRRILNDGKSGILYKYDDANDFRDKILSLVDNPQEAKLMADNAYADAKDKNSWSSRIETLEQILSNLGLC